MGADKQHALISPKDNPLGLHMVGWKHLVYLVDTSVMIG